MDDIVTEHAGGILRVQLNRPTKRNAMTSAMYLALAGIFNEAANDENTRVVLWHGAVTEFRWIIASSRVEPQNKKRTHFRHICGFSQGGAIG